jgi:hypothetical protein
VKENTRRELAAATKIQSVLRMIVTARKSEKTVQGELEQEMAAVQIQTAYRHHMYRLQWLNTCRSVIRCQCAVRRWKAIRRADELRFYKKGGPADIFEFIKTRQTATTKIQQTYQDYTTRSFESAYQDYLLRLSNAVRNSSPSSTAATQDAVIKSVSFSEPIELDGEKLCRSPENDINDLLLVEEVEERALTAATANSSAPASAKAENIVYVVDEDDDDSNLESQFFDGSRCGFSDGVHDMLMQSGKWLYEKLGDPSDDTAEDLLTVMEIGEEAAFCCWKKKTSVGRTAEPHATWTQEEEIDEQSAIIIQSKWRSHSALKRYNKVCHQMAFSQFRSSRQSSAVLVEQNKIAADAPQESAILRCQSVVRRFLALRRVQNLTDNQRSCVKKYHSPARKHVAKTGHIETLLNELDQEDASLTDFSDTASSNGEGPEIEEELMGDVIDHGTPCNLNAKAHNSDSAQVHAFDSMLNQSDGVVLEIILNDEESDETHCSEAEPSVFNSSDVKAESSEEDVCLCD